MASTMSNGEKRVTIKATHKRKFFFEQCLFDWRIALDSEKEARQRSTLWRASESMNKFPLELASGDEAAALVKGVGPQIGKRLNSAWASFERELGHEPTITDVRKVRRGEFVRFDSVSQKKSAANGSSQAKKPPKAVTAGPLAKKPKASTGSVSSTSSDRQNSSVGISSNSDSSATSSSLTAITSDINFEKTYVPFEIGSYTVVMLVDNQEAAGRKDLSVKDCLHKGGVDFEMRQLPLGDYAWLARCNQTGRELLLDCLVERKRWDDLASSIMDKRYHEQKMRLRRYGECGGKVVWLVERQARVLKGAITDDHLCQAMANTRVQDGFIVHTTDDAGETAVYLAALDRQLRSRFQSGNWKRLVSATVSQLQQGVQTAAHSSTIPLLTFAQFKASFAKTYKMSVSDVFARQLTSATGIDSQKALQLTQRFPTIALLCRASREQRYKAVDELKLSNSFLRWLNRFFPVTS